MGVVRNEIGVVTGPSGRSSAVAIFARRTSSSAEPGSAIDTLIGQVAREAFEELLGGRGPGRGRLSRGPSTMRDIMPRYLTDNV